MSSFDSRGPADGGSGPDKNNRFNFGKDSKQEGPAESLPLKVPARTSWRIVREDLDVQAISLSEATLHDIKRLMHLAGYRVPIPLLGHVAAIARTGEPVNREWFGSYDKQLGAYELCRRVDYSIDGPCFTKDWEYIFSGYDGESQIFAHIQKPDQKEPKIQFTWSPDRLDTAGSMERWKLVNRLWKSLFPRDHLAQIGNLSDFVTETGELRPDQLTLQFARARIDTTVRGDRTAQAASALEGAYEKDMAESTLPPLFESGGDEEIVEMARDLPGPGEPLTLVSPRPAALAAICTLSALELPEEFMCYLLNVLKADAEIGDEISGPCRALNRRLEISHIRLHQPGVDSGECVSTIEIRDTTGPFSPVLRLERLFVDTAGAGPILNASFFWQITPEKREQLPWTKILLEAEYKTDM